jgi:CheY-like chemotaxis protein
MGLLRLEAEKLGLSIDSVNSVEEGIKRAAGLSRDMLGVIRGGSRERQPVDIINSVESLVALFRSALPNQVKMSCTIPNERPFVECKESQITQIVLNLLTNARDAIIETGGQIDVEVELVTVKSGARWCLLTISDDGPGIPPEVAHLVFEPFFSTKSGTSDANQNSGLGLSIVKTLSEEVGGSVALKPKPERGTSFEICLPCCEIRAPQSVKELTKKLEPKPAVVSCVLVVDDEDAVRMIIQKSLELFGYEVVSATNGEEALRIYSEIGGKFDLVIMDMIMPKLSGEELFFKLKEINPQVKVLVSSGYASDVGTKRILQNGGLGLIKKPFSVEELVTEVKKCLKTPSN